MNSSNYHYSYYNYVDNVYPAEEINPITGEIAALPDNQVENIINQFMSQPAQNMMQMSQNLANSVLQPPVSGVQQAPPMTSSRRRFFHYRGKILQVVAETEEVQPSASFNNLPTALNFQQYTQQSQNSSTTRNTATPRTPRTPGGTKRAYHPKKSYPKGPRKNPYEGHPLNLNSYGKPSNRTPEQRAMYAANYRKWRASLPPEKLEELKAKERARRNKNAEKYREAMRQRMLTDPEYAERRKKMRYEWHRKKYNVMSEEEKRQKMQYIVARQKIRVSQMTPEQYEEYRKKRQEIKRKYDEKRKQQLAQLSEAELQALKEKEREYRRKKRAEYRARKKGKQGGENGEEVNGDDPDQPSRSGTQKKPRKPQKVNPNPNPKPRKRKVSEDSPLSGAILYSMLYEFKLGHNSLVAHQNLKKAFGDDAIKIQDVSKWFERFLSGNTDIDQPKKPEETPKDGPEDPEDAGSSKRRGRPKKKPAAQDPTNEKDEKDATPKRAKASKKTTTSDTPKKGAKKTPGSKKTWLEVLDLSEESETDNEQDDEDYGATLKSAKNAKKQATSKKAIPQRAAKTIPLKLKLKPLKKKQDQKTSDEAIEDSIFKTPKPRSRKKNADNLSKTTPDGESTPATATVLIQEAPEVVNISLWSNEEYGSSAKIREVSVGPASISEPIAPATQHSTQGLDVISAALEIAENGQTPRHEMN